MHLMICYDVVKNSRRARLFRRLSGFLVPVQKSVFEGRLPDWRLPELTQVIEATIDLDTDTVRVYRLCRGCAPSTLLIGTSPAIALEPEDIII